MFASSEAGIDTQDEALLLQLAIKSAKDLQEEQEMEKIIEEALQAEGELARGVEKEDQGDIGEAVKAYAFVLGQDEGCLASVVCLRGALIGSPWLTQGFGVPSVHHLWRKCLSLSSAYNLSSSSSENIAEANPLSFLEELAQNGSPTALARLGWCYQFGIGVKQDKEKGVRLFKASAASGHPGGCNSLGVALFHGTGTPSNKELSLEMFEKAVEEGYSASLVNLAQALFASSSSSDSLRAFQLLKSASFMGDSFASWALGCCFFEGKGVNVDLTRAADCFSLSAHQGNPEGQFSLAKCFEEGRGRPKNLDLALKWYSSARGMGHTGAQWELGQHMLLRKEFSHAVRHLVDASAGGHSLAKETLEKVLVPEILRHADRVEGQCRDPPVAQLLAMFLVSTSEHEALFSLLVFRAASKVFIRTRNENVGRSLLHSALQCPYTMVPKLVSKGDLLKTLKVTFQEDWPLADLSTKVLERVFSLNALEWKPSVNWAFPIVFKDQVKILLLIHQRHDGTTSLANLPFDALLRIIGELWQMSRLYL